MDGAALPDKAAAEFLEYPVGLGHRGPAAVHRVPVVGAMLAVVGKRERVCHLPGNRPDLYRSSGGLQQRHVITIKVGDGLGSQPHALDGAIAGAGDQLVIDEIEFDLEPAVSVRHGRGGESSAAEIESDVPPVVDRWGQGQAGLANDLEPAVEG